MVGGDPAAVSYANSQKKTAEYIGIRYELAELNAGASQQDLLKHIQEFNKTFHGIIISKPVPAQINYYQASELVDPGKALEGVNVANLGKMLVGQTKIVPCTAAACMELIKSAGVDLKGKEAVVIGRSEIVGKPVSLLLLGQNATVTICHSRTAEKQLVGHLQRADVVVAAVGKPKMVKGEWLKKGAIVIDVGINEVNNKIVGDVDFDSAKERAGFITPVPGGVGPVTVVMLMRNAVEAFKMQVEK